MAKDDLDALFEIYDPSAGSSPATVHANTVSKTPRYNRQRDRLYVNSGSECGLDVALFRTTSKQIRYEMAPNGDTAAGADILRAGPKAWGKSWEEAKQDIVVDEAAEHRTKPADSAAAQPDAESKAPPNPTVTQTVSSTYVMIRPVERKSRPRPRTCALAELLDAADRCSRVALLKQLKECPKPSFKECPFGAMNYCGFVWVNAVCVVAGRPTMTKRAFEAMMRDAFESSIGRLHYVASNATALREHYRMRSAVSRTNASEQQIARNILLNRSLPEKKSVPTKQPQAKPKRAKCDTDNLRILLAMTLKLPNPATLVTHPQFVKHFVARPPWRAPKIAMFAMANAMRARLHLPPLAANEFELQWRHSNKTTRVRFDQYKRRWCMATGTSLPRLTRTIPKRWERKPKNPAPRTLRDILKHAPEDLTKWPKRSSMHSWWPLDADVLRVCCRMGDRPRLRTPADALPFIRAGNMEELQRLRSIVQYLEDRTPLTKTSFWSRGTTVSRRLVSRIVLGNTDGLRAVVTPKSVFRLMYGVSADALDQRWCALSATDQALFRTCAHAASGVVFATTMAVEDVAEAERQLNALKWDVRGLCFALDDNPKLFLGSNLSTANVRLTDEQRAMYIQKARDTRAGILAKRQELLLTNPLVQAMYSALMFLEKRATSTQRVPEMLTGPAKSRCAALHKWVVAAVQEWQALPQDVKDRHTAMAFDHIHRYDIVLEARPGGKSYRTRRYSAGTEFVALPVPYCIDTKLPVDAGENRRNRRRRRTTKEWETSDSSASFAAPTVPPTSSDDR